MASSCTLDHQRFFARLVQVIATSVPPLQHHEITLLFLIIRFAGGRSGQSFGLQGIKKKERGTPSSRKIHGKKQE